MQATTEIRQAAGPEDIRTVRALLREYAAYLNESLGEEHICLADYERELAGLPGEYAPPAGMILLAKVGEEAAGCVALKPLKASRATEATESACEMKRLWVRREFRGHSIGLNLAQALIEDARRAGYTAMYLDTVPAAMKAANRIYVKSGFKPVEQYAANAVLGPDPTVEVQFFRLAL